MDVICRALTSGNSISYVTEQVKNGKVMARLHEPIPTDLKSVIKNDKMYGLLKPKDGKSFSYRIYNKDGELTHRQVRRGITSALFRWFLEVDIDFHRARIGEDSDLKIYFKSEEEDELLTSSTLAYMYYPLGSSNNGVMVINKRFFWTNHGRGIDMHYIDPVNYPELGSGVIGRTHDLDQVCTHEFGHGIFGLPHYEGTMAPRYDLMEEFLHMNDILRASAKVGRKHMFKRKYYRLSNWIRISSERS